MSENIRYLKRTDIDIAKWDACLDKSTNGLIYGYSYYLDIMSRHWDGLVMNDYEAVMPLTWNRKWGISYLYQPPFTANLGIFGNNPSQELCNKFISSIPPHFKLVEIELNAGNAINSLIESTSQRNNYVLSLNKSYPELTKAYKDNVKRNVRKAQQLECMYVKEVPIDKIIHLSSELMGKISNLKAEDYERFKKLYTLLQSKNAATTRGVYSMQNELVASCVYFFSNKRCYYILVGNHPNGKTMGASHFLIDRFIEEFSNQDLLLDFEGSDLGNIAFFYNSFGATLETYPSLRVDRLPWWVRVLRRI
jgi:hypothetical protein